MRCALFLGLIALLSSAANALEFRGIVTEPPDQVDIALRFITSFGTSEKLGTGTSTVAVALEGSTATWTELEVRSNEEVSVLSGERQVAGTGLRGRPRKSNGALGSDRETIGRRIGTSCVRNGADGGHLYGGQDHVAETAIIIADPQRNNLAAGGCVGVSRAEEARPRRID